MKTSNNQPEDFFHSTARGVEVTVSVLPRSSRSKIVGVHDGALKLKLTKPPVDGAANAECCTVLAKYLGIPKSQVSVVRGATSRRKVVLVEGISEKKILELFAAIGPVSET